ncbi:biotin/lipoyl-binding protein [Zavarzinia compransoris]|uniref:acetyl-CoA carboxylase biotin carboxyl carrier protein subunit n=1 Tax=Zavarzinia marina TaxID=2911065 RepID=UPI001F36F4F3|nr:acetyl-CoA carboxylase biotin carboxyl carrier protein subunit [Zavarzinia marina]MCF4165683.1 biotin/lipoyl-binding protein [Zavarzinia marina]
MRHLLIIDETEAEAGLTPAGDDLYILHDAEGSHEVSFHGYAVRVDDVMDRVAVAVDGNVAYVHLNGRAHRVEFREPVDRFARGGAGGGADAIAAPMPGSVVAVNVEAGQSVAAGQVMMVIESMKLETAIKAPRDAVIETVHVSAGKTFNKGAPLIALVPLEEE